MRSPQFGNLQFSVSECKYPTLGFEGTIPTVGFGPKAALFGHLDSWGHSLLATKCSKPKN